MMQPRLSSQGKGVFLSHNLSGCGSCKYSIILLLTLAILSMGFIPLVSAANTTADTNSAISVSFNTVNTSATNLSFTHYGAGTLYDSNISMYPPVPESDPDEINLTARAIAENETYAYNQVDKGIECYNSGNIACSFESFAKAHDILPHDSNILYVQAQALTYQKRYDEALAKIDAGIALDPERGELWYQRGIIQNDLGRFFESGASFDRAAELSPGSEFPVTDRFPVNILLKYATLIVLVTGFIALGCVFYFREIRQ